MKTIDRVKQFIDYKRIGLSKFDEIIGAGRGYIGKQITRKASIGSDVLEKIVSEFPEINAFWLLTGEGQMLKSTKLSVNTHETTGRFMEPDDEYSTNTPTVIKQGNGRKALKGDSPSDSPTKFLAPQIISVDNDKDENILYVKTRAAAGYLDGFSDPEYLGKLPAFNLPGLNKKTYRAFEVDGDSMYPTLENKDMVIGEWVDGLDKIREDHVHIVVTKSRGVIVKRLLNRINKYGVIIAKSDAVDNRNLYPNIEIEPDDIQEIWFAVFHGGYKFRHPTDMYKRVNNIEADFTHLLEALKKAGIEV